MFLFVKRKGSLSGSRHQVPMRAGCATLFLCQLTWRMVSQQKTVEDSSKANKTGQLLDSLSGEANYLPRQRVPWDYILESQVVTWCNTDSAISNSSITLNSGLPATDLVAVIWSSYCCSFGLCLLNLGTWSSQAPPADFCLHAYCISPVPYTFDCKFCLYGLKGFHRGYFSAEHWTLFLDSLDWAKDSLW